MFKEFVNDPKHYQDRVGTHVIVPFDIPLSWPRYMSFDHGFSKPFSVGYWAVDMQGRAYRYREWYGCVPRRANVGIELTPRQIADGIIQREAFEHQNNVQIERIADPAIWDKSRGDSVADQMRPTDKEPGVYFRKGDNTRLAGKMQLHERLRFDQEGKPGIYIFNTCHDWLRTVPNLPYSLKKPEDVDTDAEDHAYDDSRYFLMARPVTPKKTVPVQAYEYNPYQP